MNSQVDGDGIPSYEDLKKSHDALYAALDHLTDRCKTYGGFKGGKMDLFKQKEALANARKLLGDA